jgi:hypothetical protein
MTKNRIAISALVLTLVACGQLAFAQNDHCKQVGGSILTNIGELTNFGVSDPQNTTLGVVTGDLKGAVAAKILAVSPGANGTVLFSVQHHFVTDAGDSIFADVAHATTQPLSQTLFAILSYPVKITGGTGRYANAHGLLNSIGEVDLATGRTSFRYFGQVCFSQSTRQESE